MSLLESLGISEEDLRDMDPDMVVDELGISSEELVNKFKNKAKAQFYRFEYEGERDADQDD